MPDTLLKVFTQFPVFIYYLFTGTFCTTISQVRKVWSSDAETMELEEGSSFICLFDKNESQETSELWPFKMETFLPF